ncbi:MAG: histidine phosphatase family protein [Vicinamibacteraceae bacterium]
MLTRARLTRILVAAIAAVLTAALHASAQQAVIVVRHAEKADQTPDTALSAKGRARAKALADLLRSAGVTHIITSEFQRTRDTAAPLAAALGLTIEQVPARDLPALSARIRALDPASIVVVVGHSNTIPPMLTVLGWPNQLDLHEGDYDNIFVLAPHPGQRASMVRLKYGQPSS